jgi:hypothetical protein
MLHKTTARSTTFDSRSKLPLRSQHTPQRHGCCKAYPHRYHLIRTRSDKKDSYSSNEFVPENQMSLRLEFVESVSRRRDAGLLRRVIYLTL